MRNLESTFDALVAQTREHLEYSHLLHWENVVDPDALFGSASIDDVWERLVVQQGLWEFDITKEAPQQNLSKSAARAAFFAEAQEQQRISRKVGTATLHMAFGFLDDKDMPVLLLPLEYVFTHEGNLCALAAAALPRINPLLMYTFAVAPSEQSVSSALTVGEALGEISDMLKLVTGGEHTFKIDYGVAKVPAREMSYVSDMIRHKDIILDHDAAPYVLSRIDIANNIIIDDEDEYAGSKRELLRCVGVGVNAGPLADAELLDGTESFVLKGTDTASAIVATSDIIARRLKTHRNVAVIIDDEAEKNALIQRLTDFGYGDKIFDTTPEFFDAQILEPLLESPDNNEAAHIQDDVIIEPYGLTPAQAAERIAELEAFGAKAEEDTVETTAPWVRTMTRAKLLDMRQALDTMVQTHNAVDGGVEVCPWNGARIDLVDAEFRSKARSRLDDLELKSKQAAIAYQTMERETGLSFKPTLANLDAAATMFEHANECPGIPSAWTFSEDYDELYAICYDWATRRRELLTRASQLADLFRATWEADADLAQQAAEIGVNSIPLQGEANITLYAQKIQAAVDACMSKDPHLSLWKDQDRETIETGLWRAEQLTSAFFTTKNWILNYYMPDVFSIDHQSMREHMESGDTMRERRVMANAHKQDIKLVKQYISESHEHLARDYTDENMRELLDHLKAYEILERCLTVEKTQLTSALAGFYQGVDTRFDQVRAARARMERLLKLREAAYDLEQGILWADAYTVGLNECFGELYNNDPLAVDWDGEVAQKVMWMRDFAKSAQKIVSLDAPFVQAILSPQKEENTSVPTSLPHTLGFTEFDPYEIGFTAQEVEQKAERWATRLRECFEACAENEMWFASCFEDPIAVLELPVNELANRTHDCVNNLRLLEYWTTYEVARRKVEELGLMPFVESAVQNGASLHMLASTFEAAFLQGWIANAQAAHGFEAAFLSSLVRMPQMSAARVWSHASSTLMQAYPCVFMTSASVGALLGPKALCFDAAVMHDVADETRIEQTVERTYTELMTLAHARQVILIKGDMV